MFKFYLMLIYLPTQNFEKISSKTKSETFSPVSCNKSSIADSIKICAASISFCSFKLSSAFSKFSMLFKIDSFWQVFGLLGIRFNFF